MALPERGNIAFRARQMAHDSASVFGNMVLIVFRSGSAIEAAIFPLAHPAKTAKKSIGNLLATSLVKRWIGKDVHLKPRELNTLIMAQRDDFEQLPHLFFIEQAVKRRINILRLRFRSILLQRNRPHFDTHRL